MEKTATKAQKERKPGHHIENPRVPDKDGYMVRVTDITNAWRHARDAGTGQSLKQFARALASEGDEHAKRWLHNKRVNTKKNQLAVGCTRKKKGGKN